MKGLEGDGLAEEGNDLEEEGGVSCGDGATGHFEGGDRAIKDGEVHVNGSRVNGGRGITQGLIYGGLDGDDIFVDLAAQSQRDWRGDGGGDKDEGEEYPHACFYQGGERETMGRMPLQKKSAGL